MKSSDKTILITGAKGFLGREIVERSLVPGYKLRLLIRNSSSVDGNVEDFIRDEYTNESLRELFASNVEVLKGDITSEFLGLDEDDYKRLSYEVDEVFHCAAATHFENQREEELMRVNVTGTENILDFAKSVKTKTLHYISTAYGSGMQEGTVLENEHSEETQFKNEYEKSKHIAERTVIKFSKENLIPYVVYRPSIIVGDSRTGITSRFDNLYLFAKVLVNIKDNYVNSQLDDYGKTASADCNNTNTIRVPGDPNAFVNIVPIDYVADAIVAISKKKEAINRIFNVVNPGPPTLSELKTMIMPVLGADGLDVHIESQLEGEQLNTIEKLFLRQTKSYYSYLFSKLNFDCKNTQELLNDTGIYCPSITKDLLKLLMDYAISHNWGQKETISLQEVEAC